MKAWYAIYTKPRAEKKVASRLSDRGIDMYCPLKKTMRQWSDRKKMVEIPVFPSYVFVHIEPQERQKVLETPGVVQFVYWLGKPAVIRQLEIDRIREFLEEFSEVQFNPIPVTPGMRVKIKEGALKENQGVVLEVKNNRVVLRLEKVGFELSAEIHISKLGIIKS